MVITAENNYKGLKEWLEGKKKTFIVCRDLSRITDEIQEIIHGSSVDTVQFSDFMPNPVYESVVKGVNTFREEECDSIIAIGGGSAIDVAKCIKLFSGLEGNGIEGEWIYTYSTAKAYIPMMAVPTTAGTGSEVTKYAVIYYKGIKQSITNDTIVPEHVLMEPRLLETLPEYQRKATMCDALCHAIESFWSVNSTDESKGYSREAIRGIFRYMEGYLSNTVEGNRGMLMASYKAGKAINITQTTAGHAMCYKITSLFGCAHGHSAILCNRVLYPWMVDNLDKCVDARGHDYLSDTLNELGYILGSKGAKEGADKIGNLFVHLKLFVPKATKEQFVELRKSINPERMNNHPVLMNEMVIDELYHQILR